MGAVAQDDITRLLREWSSGDEEALNQLAPLVHRELQQDRAHFFRLAAKKMREILVDYARKKRFEKRGGSVKLVSLEEATPVQGKEERPVDLILLNSAWTNSRHSTLERLKLSKCDSSRD